MPHIERDEAVRFLAVAIPTLAGASLAIAILQDGLGVPNPSAVYILAVVAVAVVSGTRGAAIASVAAFLLYNFLFVEPRYTFTVANLGELLNLFLLLVVGFVVGQLAARQRARAEDAIARENEARALFQISRVLATRASTPEVLPTIATIVRDETGMTRVWIALGADAAAERATADTGDTEGRPPTDRHNVLQRMPGDVPARWNRVHQPSQQRARQATDVEVYRVRIDAAGESYGSIWAIRPRATPVPNRTQTRLLAAAADQIGQTLRQDRLAAEARAAEIARQSDMLKSALLQSVSHDLRTPLATIRAAAGTLRPGVGLSEADQSESAEAIDREVEYLDRLVTNLLDLSRIEAGALRAELDVYELEDLVERTLQRVAPRLAPRPVEVTLTSPPVNVDPVFLDEALTNALENAAKYTPPDAPIRITATAPDRDGLVRLTVEDGGPGVPDDALPRLFDKFYRVPGGRGGSRSGTGIGLAVARGLIEAMGGRIAARRSELGGLAVDVDLPVAVMVEAPASDATEARTA
jgi:two-component system sensor histidine kinase KdpD